MQALALTGEEKRRGLERRRRADPSYRGPERRRGNDRRAASGGRSSQRTALQGGNSTHAGAARQPVAHRLGPITGNTCLSPLVVIMRIASEFAYIDADEAVGCERVEEVIHEMERRNRRARDPLLVERIEQLGRVKDRAVHVCFGDNPGCDKSYLCAVVIPGEPMIFEYESAEHEESVQSLLERCAKILGYGVGKAIAGDLTANFLPAPPPRRR
ncbi:MAG: hypothetical protein ACT4PS_09875 [Betaproteobacteria bacterium]